MIYMKEVNKKDFRNLANLMGIPNKYGWIGLLDEKLGFQKNTISRWIKRGSISDDGLNNIEQKGYPRSKWIVSEDNKKLDNK